MPTVSGYTTTFQLVTQQPDEEGAVELEHEIQVKGSDYDFVEKYFKKGSIVSVEGSLIYRSVGLPTPLAYIKARRVALIARGKTPKGD